MGDEAAVQTTSIASGTRVRGSVVGDGDVTIDGNVEGKLAVRGDVTVGDSGFVSSSLEAVNVTVSGGVDGELRATGHVRIAAGARVRGTLTVEGLSIEDGALVAARVECNFELPKELEGTGR